ncbi:MAG: HEAT repeat domain-containing protein [Vicinamibacterales bacterium]|jgi:hypothetical protein
MTDTQPAVEIARGHFLAAGFHELQRRYARFTMRRTIRQQAAERAAALTALGQRAWDEQIDLSSFSELRDRLTALDARVGEISQTKSALESRKASLEQERRAEVDTFTSRRQAVLDKKNPIDAALGQFRSRKAGCERTMAHAEARLAAIPAEFAAVDRDLAAGGADPAKAQTATGRRSRLAAEQAELGPKLTAARSELPGLAAEDRRLSAESQECASQIAGIDAEQKAALGRIDGELGRVRSGLDGAAQQSNTAQQERREHFGRLGESLYDARVNASVLSEQTARVAAIDRARAESEATLERSLAVTRTLVPGTMGKFWGAVAGVLVLVIVLASIANRSANRAAEDRTASESAGAAKTSPQSPFANAQQTGTDVVRRFAQMGTESPPQLRADAVRILKADLEMIGSTADPAYLPILVPVLRSDDPELRKAAADAIGLIGPTDEETAELKRLLNDPVPGVAAAARRALAERPR